CARSAPLLPAIGFAAPGLYVLFVGDAAHVRRTAATESAERLREVRARRIITRERNTRDGRIRFVCEPQAAVSSRFRVTNRVKHPSRGVSHSDRFAVRSSGYHGSEVSSESGARLILLLARTKWHATIKHASAEPGTLRTRHSAAIRVFEMIVYCSKAPDRLTAPRPTLSPHKSWINPSRLPARPATLLGAERSAVS